MPGTPVEIQDLSPVLKNVYLPWRKNLFQSNQVLLAQAKKIGPQHVDYAGNDLFFDVKTDRRGGFVASARGYFPDALNAPEKQGRLSISRMYASVYVDGFALKATENSKGSYISAAKKIVDDVMEAWELEQNRVLHGDSLGIRAVVTSGANSATQTVDSPYGISGAGPGNLHLSVGDTVSFRSSTGATLRGKRKITAISLSGDTATLTVDSSVNTTTGDILVTGVPATTNSTDDSFGAEPHGLKSIMDVEAAFSTFEGISDNRWVAQKLTSTTVDEMVVMRLLNTIRARSAVDTRKNPKSMLLLTTTGIWSAYGESLLGLRRFAAPTMEIEGGFTGTKVANGVLVDDPWSPRGRLYAIHGPDTVFIDLMDFGKVGYQDSPRWRPAQLQDGFDAIFGAYWNYGVSVRQSHGVISGITDSVNYSPIF
jgi:hypothetical protein